MNRENHIINSPEKLLVFLKKTNCPNTVKVKEPLHRILFKMTDDMRAQSVTIIDGCWIDTAELLIILRHTSFLNLDEIERLTMNYTMGMISLPHRNEEFYEVNILLEE